MRRFGIWTFISLTVFTLLSCSTVKPPQRPVAYIYPSLVPMSAIQLCTPVQLDDATIRKLLNESRTLSILENAGLRQSEIAILARGLAKHGYAELDARRSKSDISWLTISCRDDSTVIRAIFRNKPNDFNRFGIPTKNMIESIEQGYYGELKQVASARKDNVTLRHVKSRNSSSWEIYFYITSVSSISAK